MRFRFTRHVSFALLIMSGTCFAQTGGTLDKIRQNDEIVFGYRETAIPFSYMDASEKPVGFSIDLCNKIADAVKQRLKLPGIKVKYQAITASNRIPLLVNGAIDVECGSTTNTVERQKTVDFLDTTFVTGTRVMVKTASGVKSIDDLKGKAIAVTAGTNNIKAVQEVNVSRKLGLNLVYGKDHAESLLLLQTGRVSGFATDDILLYSLRAGARDPSALAVVGPMLSTEPYALMIRKGDEAFKQVANDALLQLFKSGEFRQIYARWFNAPVPPKGITLGVPLSEPLQKLMASPNSNGV
ncbi:amino acid ABC transporter substrate-binding protein [Burkholderia sp. MR1-5-21]